MISEFICDICKLLNIPVPAISSDITNFSSDTMLAQVNSTGDTIFLKDCDTVGPDLFFAIAHELRHIWQLQNDEQLFFSTYKPVNSMSSVEEYNLQIAEIDANAFAGLVMIDYFSLKPLFEGIPDSVKVKIYERMGYLKSIL